MSAAKRASKSKSSQQQNCVNDKDQRENITGNTKKQLIVMQTKRDSNIDRTTHNAARLQGKVADKIVYKKNVVNEQVNNRENIKNKKQTTLLGDDEDDEEDDDDDDDGDDNDDDNERNNNDEGNRNDCDEEESKSGFSNGSCDRPHCDEDSDSRHEKDSELQNSVIKPVYTDELLQHGRNDTVAMDVQLIKGVLPDLFAVLKILESDDDLVYNGIISCYFFKKLQVVESKRYDWWKRNCNAVRKSIDGRRASVCNVIKRSFMGTYSVANQNKFYAKLMLTIVLSDLRVTEELPSIHDILKLRKNLQAMRVVCDHFLPCVVGKKDGSCRYLPKRR